MCLRPKYKTGEPKPGQTEANILRIFLFLITTQLCRCKSKKILLHMFFSLDIWFKYQLLILFMLATACLNTVRSGSFLNLRFPFLSCRAQLVPIVPLSMALGVESAGQGRLLPSSPSLPGYLGLHHQHSRFESLLYSNLVIM